MRMKAQLTAVVRSLNGALYLPYSVVIVDCMDIGVVSRIVRVSVVGPPLLRQSKPACRGLWAVVRGRLGGACGSVRLLL